MIEYEANLYRILNRTGKPLEEIREIRKIMTSQFFIRWGIKAIDQIVKRTQSGKNVKGENFPAYSKSYKNSLVYQIYGKTNKVNLTLSSEMLNSIGIGTIRGGIVRLIIRGRHNQDKARGHHEGIPRRVGKPVTVKRGNRSVKVYRKTKVKRPFLGLSDKEEVKILNETIREEIGLVPLARATVDTLRIENEREDSAVLRIEQP